MSLSRRTLARAGVLAFGALTLAACKDSTAPLNVTPGQLQSIGESVASEVQAGMSQLTAQDVISSNGGAPTFSRVPHSSGPMMTFRGLSFNRYAMSRSSTDISQCGVASQNPPVDTDGDQVPDNLTVTFDLPACHFVDQTSTFDVTGHLNISDPHSTEAGMDLNFALQNFKISFSSPDASGYISRTGSGSVSLSSGSLYQTATWTDNAVITGLTSASDNISWTNNFAAAQGQSIVAGRSLPDGTYTPNGSVNFQQGNRTASFSVETKEALQYSAACADGVAAGTSLSPFTSGRVRVSVSNQDHAGYADITYSNCNSATVTLVTQ